MTKKSEDRESPENEHRLLSSEERAIISKIAAMEPPHSWRAAALLAIDEGATQAEAGRQAGLTFGQLRYWLDKFRKDRTSIFPEELLNLAQQEDADLSQGTPDTKDLEQTAGDEEAQQVSLDAEDSVDPFDESEAIQEDKPVVKGKPKKKPKKAKKQKKEKKPKKTKKAKKGKKSKKKSKKKRSKKAKSDKGKSSKKSKKKSKK